VPSPGTRFVVVSGNTPVVSNDQLALPFITALVGQGGSRVVAAESGQDPDPGLTPPVPEIREVFTGPLRTGPVKGKLSTVDDLEDVKGRVAAVYAMRDLPTSLGDYGVGTHASDGLVPGP
jgi:hypothetical protein